MLIECKHWRSNFSKEDFSQLCSYFAAVTEARIGVLTNGVQYKFYTDLEKPNVMDEDTFFKINMSDLQEASVDVLKNFTKDNFDLDKIRSAALDLTYRVNIKHIFQNQLGSPTVDFVDFFRDALNPKMEKQDFTDAVKRAFKEFLDEYKGVEPNENGAETDKTPQVVLTNLKVMFPDGTVIHHYHGIETYIEVLEKLGLEKIAKKRPNIVSKTPFTTKDKGIKRGNFWVRGTGEGFGTKERKKELEKIANLLDVQLSVEQVPKKKD